MNNQNLFKTLQERGYIYQMTHEKEIEDLISSDQKFTFYLGIDPTADSLHIGHFFALMVFRYLQDAGHRGILVIGGATAMVGDPSGKTDMRSMMTPEKIQHNADEVASLAKKFIKMDGENPALILNNKDWMESYDYITFLRDVGIHFNVNTMLQAEAYANRIKEGGLTFLEMGYMLLQAYDFVHLNREYGCTLQIGGSDQWGNIIAGANLGRKLAFAESQAAQEAGALTGAGSGPDTQVAQADNAVNAAAEGPGAASGAEAAKEPQTAEAEARPNFFGLTSPLLQTAEGEKMGKTVGGALWVAKDRTSTYDFYQYFYNTADGDTEMLLKLFTKKPLTEIATLMENIVEAKKVMAYEVTKLVHGADEADRAVQAARELFAGGASADAPTFEYSISQLGEEIRLIDLLFESGLNSSKSEARRNIQQGGISVNSDKITDINSQLDMRQYTKEELVLRSGKRRYMVIKVQE